MTTCPPSPSTIPAKNSGFTGQAELVSSATHHQPQVDEFLTLDGLRLPYHRNRNTKLAKKVAAAHTSGKVAARKSSQRRNRF